VAYLYAHLEPVYRFYKSGAGTHFYTPSATERDTVIARWPSIYSYEGISYWTNPENNTQPLYRFYHNGNGSHFYTASAAERDNVKARWPTIFTYEGETYRVSTAPGAGKTTVYRFYNKTNGSHFYTASEVEKDNVIGRYSATYQFEGPAFWVGQ